MSYCEKRALYNCKLLSLMLLSLSSLLTNLASTPHSDQKQTSCRQQEDQKKWLDKREGVWGWGGGGWAGRRKRRRPVTLRWDDIQTIAYRSLDLWRGA